MKNPIDNELFSVVLPGRIVEFFPETQTATVQIGAELIAHTIGETDKLERREPIEDVPVHTYGGGGWHITMVPRPGDTCLLVFSQVGYDHWFVEDKDEAGDWIGQPAPWLRRQFSVDDGFCLLGFNTLPRAIQNYSEHSQWRNEDATQSITLKTDGTIEVSTQATVVVDSPLMHVTGDVVVDGDVTASGVSLVHHTHRGVKPGPSNTGEPN